MKEQFSRHGLPDVLVTYNGPQCGRREYTKFSGEWKFKHVTSSPRHAKSNGKAESAVEVAKKIFKKAHRDNKDPWLTLLGQRNTPTQGVNSSPGSTQIDVQKNTYTVTGITKSSVPQSRRRCQREIEGQEAES